MQKIVEKLIKKNKTISTMESCTGGALVNAITNVEGSSQILKFSAVTYSNEFKIKMGVDDDVINKHSVYSIQTAKEMSKKISDFTNSDYGIGITGKLNRIDPNNLCGEDNKVYFCVYDKCRNYYHEFYLYVTKDNREGNKKEVLKKIKKELLQII